MIARFLTYIFSYTFLFHMSQVTKFIKGECKADIVFDIGAFKGQFGNSFKQSKVFFFEPNANYFKKLVQKNKNKYFHVGIGKKIEKKTFFIMPNASSSSFQKPTLKKNLRNIFFFDFLREKIKKVKVKIHPINFYFNKYQLKKIDILKIDTEGFEIDVLKGISKKNFKKIGFIIIEKQLDKYLYKNYSFPAIQKVLIKNNFKLIKKFKDPLWNYEDRIYKNKNYLKN